MSRARGLRHGVSLALFCASALALVDCAEPMRFYPRGGFVVGALPSRHPTTVQMLFGEERPTCEAMTLGVITYDAARDGVTSTQNVVLDALQARAAQLGASGLYRITFTGAGVSGAGFGFGGATFAASVQELSASGTAYVCSEELRPLGVPHR